jgi:ATP-dependent exoDNAse (exonuclease V) beta subunit
MRNHISFSALKKWNECPFAYKLAYVDGIKKFFGNEHTSFGTAMHSSCEDEINGDTVRHFDEYFLKELKSLPDDMSLKGKLVEEMREQGKILAPLAIPALKKFFGEFELVKTEEELYESIENYELKFKGFIDLVLKTPDGKYHIIDWKTCSWGWDARRKSEPMTTYQLTFYKHYYAQKHGIDPDDIETYFGLLKRTAKSNNVEIFRVTSGAKKTTNALNLLDKAMYNINNGTFIKNRLSCARCEYRHTPECP